MGLLEVGWFVTSLYLWYPNPVNFRALLLKDCNKDVDNNGDSNTLLYDSKVCTLGGFVVN